MACPHLKEVVMLFCDAYPVKKMLPLDRIATAEPCLGEFTVCPLFADAVARLAANAAPVPPDVPEEPGAARRTGGDAARGRRGHR